MAFGKNLYIASTRKVEATLSINSKLCGTSRSNLLPYFLNLSHISPSYISVRQPVFSLIYMMAKCGKGSENMAANYSWMCHIIWDLCLMWTGLNLTSTRNIHVV